MPSKTKTHAAPERQAQLVRPNSYTPSWQSDESLRANSLAGFVETGVVIRERAFGDTAIILRQEIRMFLQQAFDRFAER